LKGRGWKEKDGKRGKTQNHISETREQITTTQVVAPQVVRGKNNFVWFKNTDRNMNDWSRYSGSIEIGVAIRCKQLLPKQAKIYTLSSGLFSMTLNFLCINITRILGTNRLLKSDIGAA
jgi:hypothetical protein